MFYNIGPRVEVTDSDKHTSLLRQGINYELYKECSGV
jgi:hypothetical protein